MQVSLSINMYLLKIMASGDFQEWRYICLEKQGIMKTEIFIIDEISPGRIPHRRSSPPCYSCGQ